MFRISYVNHGYFSANSFDTLSNAMADAKRTGFDAAIYRTDAENVYTDKNKVLVAVYDVIGGSRVIQANLKNREDLFSVKAY